MRAYEKDPELRAEFARLQRGFLDSALSGVDEVLKAAIAAWLPTRGASRNR